MDKVWWRSLDAGFHLNLRVQVGYVDVCQTRTQNKPYDSDYEEAIVDEEVMESSRSEEQAGTREGKGQTKQESNRDLF